MNSINQASGDDVREYLYKVLVVGDLGTGKTSLIKRFVHNLFSSQYKATVRPAINALFIFFDQELGKCFKCPLN